MPKLTKIDRTEWADFLNTAPSAEQPTWAIIGVGIKDKGTDYNAEVSEEKWIINKNANKTIDSYALSSSVEQTAYKGDPVFEFIDEEEMSSQDNVKKVYILKKLQASSAMLVPFLTLRNWYRCRNYFTRNRQI